MGPFVRYSNLQALWLEKLKQIRTLRASYFHWTLHPKNSLHIRNITLEKKILFIMGHLLLQ